MIKDHMLRNLDIGGNVNIAIAPTRLGLRCIPTGHVGRDRHGEFLRGVLEEEGISMIGIIGEEEKSDVIGGFNDTLCYWVLVDPFHDRARVLGRPDVYTGLAFAWMNNTLSTEEVKASIDRAKVMFFSGHVFVELPEPHLVLVSALNYVVEVDDTAVFFDPGPRGKSLAEGSAQERFALKNLMTLGDVLLLTAEAACSLTGGAV